MKTIVFFGAILSVAFAATLPANEQQAINKVHKNCQSNPSTYVDESKLKDLATYGQEPQVGVHMLCMSKGSGVQNQSGQLDKGVVKSKVLLVIKDQGKANEITNKCAVSKDTPEKTAVAVYLCLNQNSVPFKPDLA
nr:odorant binding protein 12 [Aromia bungii]